MVKWFCRNTSICDANQPLSIILPFRFTINPHRRKRNRMQWWFITMSVDIFLSSFIMGRWRMGAHYHRERQLCIVPRSRGMMRGRNQPTFLEKTRFVIHHTTLSFELFPEAEYPTFHHLVQKDGSMHMTKREEEDVHSKKPPSGEYCVSCTLPWKGRLKWRDVPLNETTATVPESIELVGWYTARRAIDYLLQLLHLVMKMVLLLCVRLGKHSMMQRSELLTVVFLSEWCGTFFKESRKVMLSLRSLYRILLFFLMKQ